jgi:hypothetical protein
MKAKLRQLDTETDGVTAYSCKKHNIFSEWLEDLVTLPRKEFGSPEVRFSGCHLACSVRTTLLLTK